MDKLRLIIAGSRHMRVSLNFIKGLLVFHEIPLECIEEIVHGDADGIDYCAKMFAKKMGIKDQAFPYKSELGKAGGPVRNEEMAMYALHHQDKLPCALCLIWDGRSRGSANMRFQATSRGIPLFEIILHSPNQGERKKLGLYIEPKDRKSTVHKTTSDSRHPVLQT